MFPRLTLFCCTILLLLQVVGCAPVLREEARRPQQALREVKYFYPAFSDDMDLSSLCLAIERNLEFLKRLDPDYLFHYGAITCPVQRVIETQQRFLAIISQQGLSQDALNNRLRDEFMLLKATGRQGNPKVLFTGYFEPTFEASPTPDQVYRHPIYRLPEDLLTIDLSLFREGLKGIKLVGRLEGKEVLPYYTREQIVAEKVLAGRGLEIAWLKDPVDVLFLQIQGSGRLVFPDGQVIHVGYAASNGHPYRSIGRYMVEQGYLGLEQVSMQSIRQYLKENPYTADEILSHNPSYVFFRELDSGPIGNIGVVLTPGRSIALDARLFPKGALCFITTQKPLVDRTGNIIKWVEFSRFVLNQDTGGAIRGAGRADIFWGAGPYAEIAAGHLRHEGDLYILLLKK